MIEEHGLGNYIKYNTYHREKTKQHHGNRYHKLKFQYDEVRDKYRCLEGRELKFNRIGKQITNKILESMNVSIVEDARSRVSVKKELAIGLLV